MKTYANVIVNGRGFFISHDGQPSDVVPAVVEMWKDATHNSDKFLLAFYEDAGGFVQGTSRHAEWVYRVRAEGGMRLYITMKYAGRPLFDNRALTELEQNLLADGNDNFITEELERMGL